MVLFVYSWYIYVFNALNKINVVTFIDIKKLVYTFNTNQNNKPKAVWIKMS